MLPFFCHPAHLPENQQREVENLLQPPGVLMLEDTKGVETSKNDLLQCCDRWGCSNQWMFLLVKQKL